MHKAIVAGGSVALLVLFSTGALADCMEDAEAYGLAAQQNAGGEMPVPLTVKDPLEQTPAVVGFSAYSKRMHDDLREAIAAARAGDETQCLRMIDKIRKGL